MTLLKLEFGVAGILLIATSLHANTIIWANDARGNNSHIEEFDGTTGARDLFSAPSR